MQGAGKGSTFTVRLPAVICSENAQTGTAADAKLMQVSCSRKLRILVADDNVDAAESLVNLFQLMGHDTCLARDGIEAFQAAQRFVPDIAFLDIGMPGMNGNEVAAAVRKENGIQHVRLVALTGWGAEHDRVESRSAGFDHHLTKPMDIEMVRKLLAEFI